MNVFELEASITLDKSGFEVGINEVKDSGEKAGKSISSGFGGNLAKVASVAKTAATAAIAVGKAVYAAGSAFYNKAKEVAEFGDAIDKASQRLGVTSQFYQEWEAVLGHSGTSMDSMTGAFKTLANAAQGATKDQEAAFKAIGLTLDEVKGMSQEELFTNVVKGLGQMEEGTERAALAQDLLGRSAMELGPLLNSIGDDPGALDAMIERFDQLGLLTDEDVKAAARFQDSLQDMETAFSGVSNAMVADFLPGLSDIMDGITNIFAGESGAEEIANGIDSMMQAVMDDIPIFLEVGAQIVAGIVEGIVAAIPEWMSGLSDIYQSLYESAVEFAPTFEEAGYKFIEYLADGMPGAISLVLGMINNLGAAIFTVLASFISGMLQKGAELVGGVASGISAAVGQAVAAVVGIGNSIVNSIQNFVGQMLAKGSELISNLASGVSGAISLVVGAINTIINGIKMPLNAVDLTSIGANIINGLWNGIKSKFQVVIDGITNFAGRVNAAFKAATQQASPSRLWRKYGQYLLDGLELGINDRAGKVINTVTEFAKAINSTYLKSITAIEDEIAAITEAQDARAKERELRERQKRLDDLYAKLAAATGDDIAKYEQEIADLKEQYAEADLKEQENAHIKELQATEKHLADMQELYEDAMDEIADTYDDSMRDIEKSESRMQSKLFGYGDLFSYEKTRTGNKMQLGNLDYDIQQLNKYSEILNALSGMGIPASLMSEILDMSVDDAIAYGEKLQAMGSGTFQNYLAKWNEREALASSISSGWYAGDKAEAQAVRTAAEARANLDYAEQLGSSIGEQMSSALHAQIEELIRGLTTEQVVIQIDGQAIAKALIDPLNRAKRQKGLAVLV